MHLRSLERTIYRLEQAKIAMPKGYCSETGCLNPNTRNGTCSKHDRTPLKLERDQPGLYFGEYRGHRVRIESHGKRRWRASAVMGTGTPIICWGTSCRGTRSFLVNRIDLWVDHKIRA